MFELIVRGGLVIDGTGRPGDLLDVCIANGRVAALVPPGEASAGREIDATGCLVTPGFVDIHSHSDLTLLADPRARSAIAPGVTTEVVGNCGHGCAPIRDPNTVAGNIYGYDPSVDLAWRTVGGYLERLEAARPAVNVATLVPHGNLRLAAVGLEDRPATEAETREMARLLEEGLAEGAIGYSTGLEYAAERASGREELVRLAGLAARHGGYWATHTRNRDTHALEAIEEAIDVAWEADAPLQISHIIPRRARDADAWQRALELTDRARDSGLDATFDSHTRLHATTNLSTVLPPGELAYRGPELAARLRRPEVRAAVKRYPSLIASWSVGGWERAYLLTCPGHPEWAGRSFVDLADGRDPMDAVLDVLIAEADDPHGPLAYYHSHEEEWLLGTMQHPFCMIGSDATDLATDGPLAGATFLGAYTWTGWFLRRMVRETSSLRWEQAIHRLTDLPAQRAGLSGRGRIAKGYRADITVFDPERVTERGTLQEPNRYAEGFVHVLVNGEPALLNGAFTAARTGYVIRRGT